MMSTRVGGAWLAGSLLLGLVGCAAGLQLAKEQLQDPGQLLFNGHPRAESDCWYCHDGTGRGTGRGPDLSARVPDLPDEAILKAIAQGIGFMPAYRDLLSAEEQKLLLGWMRAAFGGGAPEAVDVGAEEIE